MVTTRLLMVPWEGWTPTTTSKSHGLMVRPWATSRWPWENSWSHREHIPPTMFSLLYHINQAISAHITLYTLCIIFQMKIINHTNYMSTSDKRLYLLATPPPSLLTFICFGPLGPNIWIRMYLKIINPTHFMSRWYVAVSASIPPLPFFLVFWTLWPKPINWDVHENPKSYLFYG